MAYNDAMAGMEGEGRSEVEASVAMRKVFEALKHTGAIKVLTTSSICLFGIMLGVICLVPLLMLAIRNTWSGFQFDWLAWLLLLAPIAGITGVVFLVRHTLRKIHRFRLGIRQRIEHSDLLERIAQGPGGLPDISEYTAFPWRLMLGGRPKTLARMLQAVAYNIEWYLLPEPRPYIKPEWRSLLVESCLIPVIAALPYIFIFSKGASGHNLTNMMLLVGMNSCLPLFMLVMALQSSYQNSCMVLTRQALSDIIRDRYGLQ